MGEESSAIFKDIRRYYCEFCGICRSKKALITSHIRTHHKEKLSEEKVDGDEARGEEKSNTCGECGASFKKPAYLKQHMQSHSLEEDCFLQREALDPAQRIPKCERLCKSGLERTSIRPYKCSVDDCHVSYRRKDHLTRHLLLHEGKLFKCPIEECKREFVFQGNVKRHVKELHEKDAPFNNFDGQKEFVCAEMGCGKSFRFLSKLQKHENSHVKLDSVEAICLEPGCMKYFSNEKCLRAHIQSCHRYINCEICGTKQLKKNIKRHLRTHEPDNTSTERIKCQFEGCRHTFSTKTNLNQHVKAVHLEVKPFACGFSGCDKRFSFKHVRDNHEKSGIHVYTPGDFQESDELFRSKPRGGRKRKCPTIEMLVRKRVTPPTGLDGCHLWSLNEQSGHVEPRPSDLDAAGDHSSATPPQES